MRCQCKNCESTSIFWLFWRWIYISHQHGTTLKRGCIYSWLWKTELASLSWRQFIVGALTSILRVVSWSFLWHWNNNDLVMSYWRHIADISGIMIMTSSLSFIIDYKYNIFSTCAMWCPTLLQCQCNQKLPTAHSLVFGASPSHIRYIYTLYTKFLDK